VKIITIIGARPQFIKAAVVSREIGVSSGMEEVIIHTGQHFDKNMSDVFFEEMEIPAPNYHLNINSVNHGAMIGRMMEKIEEILLVEKPEFVLVYGDTNSTLAGALSAKKLHIRVVHVEAGLRSFNMLMPEEINRVLTDRISDVLCCPTDNAVENLRQEGFEKFPCKFSKTGDVLQDAAYYYRKISSTKSDIIHNLNLKERDFVLCTIHRADNTEDLCRLNSIISALNEIGHEIDIVFPVHPRTAKIIEQNNIAISFKPISPVSYFDMIELLNKSKIVMTDSGGLQKEAFFFAKPCITLRDETEWVELIEQGFNCLSGADKEKILGCFEKMQKKTLDFNQDLYGTGQASKKIIKAMKLL